METGADKTATSPVRSSRGEDRDRDTRHGALARRLQFEPGWDSDPDLVCKVNEAEDTEVGT